MRFFVEYIKAVRGSDPDASLYWLSRMLTSGCDPHYLARKMVRMASEDIGNAEKLRKLRERSEL